MKYFPALVSIIIFSQGSFMTYTQKPPRRKSKLAYYNQPPQTSRYDNRKLVKRPEFKRYR